MVFNTGDSAERNENEASDVVACLGRIEGAVGKVMGHLETRLSVTRNASKISAHDWSQFLKVLGIYLTAPGVESTSSLVRTVAAAYW